MASGTTLNAPNLAALGADRLAALLIEVSTGNAVAQRRLRLALAGHAGPAEAARAIGKRLAAIGRSRTHIDWRKVGPLVVDIAAQQAAIVGQVAPADPRTAFQLMWRLVSCADPVFARSDDGSGRIAEVFREAVRRLGPLAQAAAIDPAMLADLTVEAVCDDGHGQWDDLIDALAPALGAPGLERLRDRVAAWAAGGAGQAGGREAVHRRRTGARILQRIADLRGDVDGFIAQVDPAARTSPVVAAAIARRLLEAGRLDEAWMAIERSGSGGIASGGIGSGGADQPGRDHDLARLDVLEAMGRTGEAQAFRRERFAATLDAGHLRAYLRGLPDFEDLEAEHHALAHALGHDDVHEALGFLVAWPALPQAARLVLERSGSLDGDRYDLLGPAADALAERHPLAATLLLRAMIDFTLQRSRNSRYGHAARHLAACEALAARIEDYGDRPGHALYRRRIEDVHGRKPAFRAALSAVDDR